MHMSKQVKTLSRRPILKPKQHVGIPATARYISATEVKNRFGDLLETVLRGKPAIITKHGVAKAILISMEEFSALAGTPEAELNTLTEEFDQLLDDMQAKKARRAMKAAFDAPPEELGRAAVHGVRRS